MRATIRGYIKELFYRGLNNLIVTNTILVV